MLDPHHLLRGAQCANTGLFMALRMAGEVRCEFEQLQSLLEAAIAEANGAVALDCPARRRAQNIGRAVRDLIAANARLLGEVESYLRLEHLAARAAAEEVTTAL